jgi:hypothetical protein
MSLPALDVAANLDFFPWNLTVDDWSAGLRPGLFSIYFGSRRIGERRSVNPTDAGLAKCMLHI